MKAKLMQDEIVIYVGGNSGSSDTYSSMDTADNSGREDKCTGGD
jgi:hypothetical protein